MEEKYFVKIKDDFGVTRTFEVPTLEMKEAIDKIDDDLKEEYKHDALKYSIPFSAFLNEDYITYKAIDKQEVNPFEHSVKQELLKKALWKVVKKMPNEKYKKILYMRYLGGLKFNKIAEILGCTKQSISDNYKTAIDDLRVSLAEDKDFINTYYFKHLQKYLFVETKLTTREKFQEFSQTQNLASLIPIEAMKEVLNDIKTVQKKEKKLGLASNPKKVFKEQKFNVFGKEYSIQDMIDVVSEFLEPFQEQNKEIK